MPREKIRFLVDEKGRKKSVVLPIKDYQALVEDLADMAVIAERNGDPTQSLDLVRKNLEEKWLNTISK
ncbi:MAG TPA: hypothetical protein EYM32_08290 [Dehalococcoidia bacterium]|jgi:hypothetical protein|nr:hypothetical protein [Chloroflexota bacterium]HIB10793.1 hypothetical protein [Dehalococcoidia bacterium]HIM48858.1 hypothetical protein [Dehalococcoidia bacterium]|tara:strand:+ start:8348 stop:8551 length:204 start_codon:yes stop_codon:yes gene_type:complete